MQILIFVITVLVIDGRWMYFDSVYFPILAVMIW
jgi:hypothetical protein